MPDVMTRDQRSRCMSRIRGRDTLPELAVRRLVWAKGLRYRTKSKLPGRPDMVFSSARLAVFVDGCFWHKCPIHSVAPKQHAEFWRVKINGNVQRDKRVTSELKRLGWSVMRIWEHRIEADPEAVGNRICARVVAGRRDRRLTNPSARTPRRVPRPSTLILHPQHTRLLINA